MTSWVLVTGGAKGLGAEICRTLARQGHSIVCHYNTSKAEAEAVAAECRALGVQASTIQGDFSTKESALDFLMRYQAQFPHTDVLVNNVGNYLLKKGSGTHTDEGNALFWTNVQTPLLLLQGLLHTLTTVVNIGTAGLEGNRADTRSPLYRSTKMALLSLTKSFARELAPRGIRINMVSPGHLSYSVDLPHDISHIPMQRAATVQEVARCVAFLIDKESSYITGQNIEVAGGIGL